MSIHIFSTLFYPLGWDQGIHIYIANQIQKGEILYKNLFDHKGPAIYYTNFLIGKFFGFSDFNIMFFNFVVGIFGSILTYKISRCIHNKNNFLNHIAVILFLLFYFSNDSIGHFNQFENYISVLLLFLIYLTFRYKEFLSPIIFGLVLSYITLIKPPIYWLFSIPFAYFILKNSNKKFIDILIFLFSFFVPIIGIFLYFYFNDAIYHLYWCLIKFNSTYAFENKLKKLFTNKLLISHILFQFAITYVIIKDFRLRKKIFIMFIFIVILSVALKFMYEKTNLEFLVNLRNFLPFIFPTISLFFIIKLKEENVIKVFLLIALISLLLIYIQKMHNYHFNILLGIFPIIMIYSLKEGKILTLLLIIFSSTTIYIIQKRQNLIYYSYKNLAYLFKENYKTRIYKEQTFDPTKILYENYPYLIEEISKNKCYGSSGIVGKHVIDQSLAYWSNGKFINDFHILVSKINDRKAIDFYNRQMVENLNKNYKCLFVNKKFLKWVIENYKRNFYENYKIVNEIGDYFIFVKFSEIR